MTTFKPLRSSTTLVRILSLPVMAAALAGCDFASKLPDAPDNLGVYGSLQKPPSVTGRGEAIKLPPPPADAFAALKAPVEDRTESTSRAAGGGKQAPLKLPPENTGNKDVSKAPAGPAPLNIAPLQAPVQENREVAFAPLEFEALETPAQPAAPVLSQTVAPAAQEYAPPLEIAAQSYSPSGSAAPAYTPNEVAAYGSYESATLDTYSVSGSQAQPEVISYQAEQPQADAYSYQQTESYSPAGGFKIAPPPVSAGSVTVPVNASPVAVLHSRLPNGAVINVHPVIGAPGAASATLAQTVVSSIGSPVDQFTAQNAAVTYDLRGRAERNTDTYVSVEWILQDASGSVIGVFPERQNGGNWTQMDKTALLALGQRVSDRIARNAALRQATLYAASRPLENSVISTQRRPNTTFVLTKGATLADAPLPRVSPRRSVAIAAPLQTVALTQTPRAPIRQLIQPVRIAPPPRAPAPRTLKAPPTQPARPAVTAQAPAQPVRIAPPPKAPTAPAVPRREVAQASLVAPPPAFDTLSPQNAQPNAPAAISGPRPLVFRGVRGAPGDGDQALGREVGKLLAQSGARITNQAEPGALFLTARVSKTPSANTDRIEIIWEVLDETGVNVGQVTQENNVPRGMLDNAWGDDAFYAAQGARDGIIELLQGVGALKS